ncbi:MAG TPA: S9 family peptidase [Steroidobacteraceae bacterium]|nr:S9 family peptidase [Steroidobacteraceae bacterium]
MNKLSSDRRSVLLALVLGMAPAVCAADMHPFGLDDYLALRQARAVAVSPDGATILYGVTWSGAKGPEKHEWHLIGTDGTDDRKLDLPEDFTPEAFTGDGAALYGLYRIEKTPQFGIVPLQSGAATRTIAFPRGITAASLSPDGSRFAILADPRATDPLGTVHTVVENAQTSLYVTGSDGSSGAWWCPAATQINDIAWSPDGTRIAVLSVTRKIGHHDVESFIDVCDAAEARRIFSAKSPLSGIAWASGGRELAFVGTVAPVLTPDHLWTVSIADGRAVDRTPNLHGSIATVGNDPRGTAWVELHRGVVVEVAAYRDGALQIAQGWPPGTIESVPVFPSRASAPEVLAYTVGDPAHASNVAVARDGALHQITHEGDATLANVSLGEVRTVHWVAKSGTPLEGIVTFPAGYVSGKRYAFVVVPHGGPESNDRLRFSLAARLIAGMGYVVLQPEYRGSTGYGTEFMAAIYQHFGDRAYADVDSATDFAVAQGWADPARLAIFGWSAGGFMTSWTVTQTQRYRAAIEGAGITDWLSFIPTSDLAQTDYDARWPEGNVEPFIKFSAIDYADRVTTPLLILHGEADERVPAFQGREYFVLLAERGKTVRMVTYPGAPHFPTLAEQRRDVYKEVGDWLARYNPTGQGAPSPR